MLDVTGEVTATFAAANDGSPDPSPKLPKVRIVDAPNDGALALRRSGLAYAEIGRRVRRTRAAVALWASGERRPEYAARVALRSALGVPLEAWDVVNTC
jgi:hypothetical protein